jgi:hypothetical protein
MKDSVLTNCVYEETHRRIFCLRPIIKYMVWHVRNKAALIICCLHTTSAIHFMVHIVKSSSRYRPGVAQRVPGVLGSQIS